MVEEDKVKHKLQVPKIYSNTAHIPLIPPSNNSLKVPPLFLKITKKILLKAFLRLDI